MQLEFISPNASRWSECLAHSQHDIYHLPGYLQLEAQRTQTIPEGLLVTQADCLLLLPYLIRSCDDIGLGRDLIAEGFDVISPYGYPGIILSDAAAQDRDFLQAALPIAKQALGEKGICSAFLRLHPLLHPHLTTHLQSLGLRFQGQTVSVDLTLSAEDIWRHTKRDHRNKINRCRRSGLRARMVPCDQYLATFVDIYLETMERVGAARRYREFDHAYFTQLQSVLGGHLHLCLVEDEHGEIASAGLYSEWNGIVQALFGGTRSRCVKRSPSSLETDFVRGWAKQRGNRYLHLGGGVGASQDPLFRFKAGFSQQRHDFHTLGWITDAARYQALVELRAKALDVSPQALLETSFFPAYRASIGE